MVVDMAKSPLELRNKIGNHCPRSFSFFEPQLAEMIWVQELTLVFPRASSLENWASSDRPRSSVRQGEVSMQLGKG